MTGYSLQLMAEAHRRPVIDIFNYYVEHSFAAYPDTPVEYAFFDRFLDMTRGYSAVVAVTDANEVVGFGLLRASHPAATFRRTAEVGYFLASDHVGKGLGRMVVERLINDARAIGVGCILASVSSRNEEAWRFTASWASSNVVVSRMPAASSVRISMWSGSS
ncbi:MAG: N-acetyltransferase family protein [Terriglobales bacterium]